MNKPVLVKITSEQYIWINDQFVTDMVKNPVGSGYGDSRVKDCNMKIEIIKPYSQMIISDAEADHDMNVVPVAIRIKDEIESITVKRQVKQELRVEEHVTIKQ